MTAFTTDYPHIRAHLACPLCNRPKDQSLLVCWPCFRSHDMRNGTSATVATILTNREAVLAATAYPKGWRMADTSTPRAVFDTREEAARYAARDHNYYVRPVRNRSAFMVWDQVSDHVVEFDS